MHQGVVRPRAGGPAAYHQFRAQRVGAPPVANSIASGAAGTTLDGVSFTIGDTGAAGFTEYCESKTRTCGNEVDTWAGEFYTNEVILFNNGVTSPVTINFATPLTSLVDLQAQANAYGAFTETLTAYDGAAVIATDLMPWFNGVYGPPGEGTIPKLSVYGLLGAADITSVTISTTNDSIGLALGGVGGIENGVPEPSTWAMIIAGFAGLAYAGYRRPARKAAAA